jgi:uncharacterized protein YyaL (SSP411 family)
LPSGAGVATELLLRLAVHLDDEALRAAAQRALRAYRPTVARSPSAFASMLAAADFFRGPVLEVAIMGLPDDPATRALVDVVHRDYHPRLALAVGRPGDDPPELPLLAHKQPVDGRPTAFVCRQYACQAPVTEPEALSARLAAPEPQTGGV